jgi:hypothetical protein
MPASHEACRMGLGVRHLQACALQPVHVHARWRPLAANAQLRLIVYLQAAVGADTGGQRQGTPHEVALARVRGGAAASLSDTGPSQVHHDLLAELLCSTGPPCQQA